MEASSTVIIKVKCGDVLRRFSAQVVNKELNLNMDGLKKRILSLFNFTPDAELILAYIDEDSDVVTLVDDDDLRDVVRQALNPLRITVELKSDRKEQKNDHSTGSSDPSTSPEVQLPSLDLGSGLSEMSIPVPLQGTIAKLFTDLIAKTSSSAPGSTFEFFSFITQVALSYMGKMSELQATENVNLQTSVSNRTTQDSESYKADSDAVISVLTDVTSQLFSKMRKEGEMLFPGRNMENSSVVANDVVAAPDFENVNASQHGNNSTPLTESDDVGKLGESSMKSSNVPSAADYIHGLKDASNLGETRTALLSTYASASSPSNGEKSDNRSTALPNRSGKSLCSTWGPVSGSYGPSPSYECPFSGMSLDNVSAAPPSRTYEASPFRRNCFLTDSNGDIFHRGVRCDGCGVHPIAGPRFKSKVKVDYDLCRVCFEKMGNSMDYVRMDRPMVYPPRFPFKGFQDARPGVRAAMLLHSLRGSKAKHGVSRLDSRFIQDVNIVDGTVMAPLTPFTKIWRMRNNGSATWAPKTQLVWIGGDKLCNALTFEVEIPSAGLLVDQEIDVAVDLISPELPGRYVSYWRMASATGQKFGQRVWVLIQVDASIKEAPHESIRNLNLNLPPLSSISSLPTGPEIVDVDREPAVLDGQPGADNSEKMVELEEPVVDLHPNVDQELKFPINNSLLVGDGTSTHPPASVSPPVSYAAVNFSLMARPSLGPLPPGMPFPYIPYQSPRAMPFPLPPAIPFPVPSAMPFPVPNPSPSDAPLAAPLLSPVPSQSPSDAPLAAPLLSPVPSQSPSDAPFAPPLLSDVELEKKLLEEKLLKELEEMGFKQVDLNRDILRMKDYDLGQTVDELCGIADWDPLLNELQEMGFHDREVNKKLLKKNNGSIKRAVMDLVTGEKI